MVNRINNNHPRLVKYIAAFFLFLFLTSCSVMMTDYTELYGPAEPQVRVLTPKEVKQNTHISFNKQVRPVLNQRCAVCHSCNDAPCQLNFTSIEGIDRGLNKLPVYNGARFNSQQPTRLGIDANSTEQWRKMDFKPVLNERRQNEQVNLDNSLLYQVLTTKRAHEFRSEGRLAEKYNVGMELIDDESFVHSQRCPDIEGYARFAQNNPQWGMPFALPPLSRDEFKTIETWLEQGAKVEPEKALSKQLKTEVDKWEHFLNGSSNKEQLMSRYLYEHLYLGHLYFEDISNKEFFNLVRSTTPPGQPIELIATVRPYNDPGVDRFYYRLKRYDRTIVDKTHLPYAIGNKRMQRYKQLFLQASYSVNELPSYGVERSANAFKIFVAIPAKNRYQFMLDDAQFFVGGFIKGPVCRGSVALSVIDDHFWVVFMDPDKSYVSQDSEFLASVSDKLRMPSELEDDARLLSVWGTYKGVARDYLTKKIQYLNEKYPGEVGRDIDKVWDGDHINANAALTVYRHYDSATVLKGFVGEVPKTGWVIDYPIFERIHYLLVSGFNVYGTVGHQLSTRLYMDFLRIEAEMEFLSFLPAANRVEIHQHWYRGTDTTERMVRALQKLKASHESKIKFETDDVKKEFFVKLTRHMQKAQSNRGDIINRCRQFPGECKRQGMSQHATSVENALQEISDIGGIRTNVFPNVTFMRIKVDGSVKNDLVYTIVRNKSYLNTTSLTAGKKMRVMEEDTIDIIPGFVGAYPNFFIQVEYKDINKFVDEYKLIENLEQYDTLIDQYGIRRTNPDFWQVSDWFYEKHLYDNPVYAGLFDLNRYNNR